MYNLQRLFPKNPANLTFIYINMVFIINTTDIICYTYIEGIVAFSLVPNCDVILRDVS